MEMSRLVTFYSNNFENNPVTFYQGCGSHKSPKDDLNNVTKLVVSRVSMTGCSHVFSDQFSSVIQSCSTLCNPMDCRTQASLSITNSQSQPKLMCIQSVMPSSHLILCHSLLLLPQITPSIMVFSNESTLRMRWPKYWSFSFSIIPSKEIPGLISFRMDWY